MPPWCSEERRPKRNKKASFFVRLCGPDTGESEAELEGPEGADNDPQDAARERYRDWQQTGSVVLRACGLVTKLHEPDASEKCVTLGMGMSSVVIISVGHPSGSSVQGTPTTRWICWACASTPVCDIGDERLVGNNELP